MMGIGMVMYVMHTTFGAVQVVLPLNDPMSGLKISSAANRSSCVMGQLGRRLLLIYLRKSYLLGCPTCCCICLANTAFK